MMQNNATVTKVIRNLDFVGAIIMIVALFLGDFYADDGGAYAAQSVKGYRLILNSDYMLGTLLILLPAMMLIVKYISSLKNNVKLIELVCPIITIIFVFVLKGQVGDVADGTVSFAMGAWIYLLGNVLALIGAGAAFFNVDLEKKIQEVAKGNQKDTDNK
ncbi:hypothetical protein [Lacticaseibacillus brantae]|uniref:Uncharacterized protein n=1 Tax=Lacticaseibacillus brantae DSM 23927 TaxID=1423727 RepID=A0A0R2B708_9LACO|nr:hypothetical protein [Lacticaseibacillus brantae]KRM72073.1 hypothetical protein FC34_GL001057 [Lacticaseibacillus brantae DSM 23927]